MNRFQHRAAALWYIARRDGKLLTGIRARHVGADRVTWGGPPGIPFPNRRAAEDAIEVYFGSRRAAAELLGAHVKRA